MKNHWVKSWSIPGTWKAIELEGFDNPREGSDKIKKWEVTVRDKKRMDHAGVSFEIETPDRIYNFSFYDSRHWNRDEDRWKEYEWSDEYNDYVPAE